MNLTEPQAGSDLAAVRTRAEPIGDGRYKLEGQKIFITYGEHDLTENIIHMVLARTPGAPEGVKGMSLFLVPKFLVNADGSLGERNDVRCLSVEHKLGIHASPTCVLAYGQQRRRHRRTRRRGESRPRIHVHHDERRALRRGARGHRVCRSARSRAALAFANERIQGTEPGAERTRADRAPSGRAPHADAHEIEDRGDARAGERSRRCRSMRRACIRMRRSSARHQAFADLMIPVVKGWCTENSVEL